LGLPALSSVFSGLVCVSAVMMPAPDQRIAKPDFLHPFRALPRHHHPLTGDSCWHPGWWCQRDSISLPIRFGRPGPIEHPDVVFAGVISVAVMASSGGTAGAIGERQMNGL
jgi:hypothetical protein